MLPVNGPASRSLTRVLLRCDEYKRREELIFGNPVVVKEICGRLERHAFFTPGQLFGLEVWEANDYGTTFWVLYILRALSPGQKGTSLPQVHPGAEVLLCVRGQKKIRRVRAWLNTLAASHCPPTDVDPDYYRAAHYRFRSGLKPRDRTSPTGKVHDFLRARRRTTGC